MQKKLEKLFQQYIEAFSEYDLNKVARCYQLPCSLSTPDRMIVVENEHAFNQEFSDIFQQLLQANTQQINALNASYLALNSHLALTCVDWAFINDEGETFADFSAFYHIDIREDNGKIISVSSFDLSQSQQFSSTLDI